MSSPIFSSKFSVVEFLEEKSFAAVPSTWLSEDDDKQMCSWPKGVKLLELIQDSKSKPKSTWKKLEVKIFRSFGSDDYKRANLNVDEARVLSSGETQSSSSDSENLNSRRNKIHRNPVETSNLPFKPPISAFNLLSGEATPSSSSSSALLTDFTPITNSTTEVPTAPDCDINISEVTPFVIQTVPSESDNIFRERVLHYLEGLKTEVNLLSIKVGTLLAAKNIEEEDPSFEFPLLIDEHVDQFEQWLGDPKSRKILLVDLVKIGGLDVNETTVRILSHVFSHSIALKTSKTGKGDGNKFSFMKWKCSSIIIDAILKNPKCHGKTKFDVEKIIEKWFNGAKDRNGGREERRKNKNSVTTILLDPSNPQTPAP
ncbi:hypothetical protein Fcan01_25747 [Folsomia candida]|uniref:DUF4806 domain-containing protein n=1 Tax=Folsomia candida TaxID=158441 RepID=A0A226D2J9_FOLCA|nr:hypothetical protein Fcan01_25747 [Folsomia candida]